jgi:hypothetical protein
MQAEKRKNTLSQMPSRKDIHILLTELSNLPGQVTDQDWSEKIDPEFRTQVDDGAGFPRMTPEEAKFQAAKAEARRKRKIETQRQRRAEGRAS